MADILSVPLKKHSDIDIINPLTNLIKSSYSTSDNPEDYSSEITELSELRSCATRYALAKQETALPYLHRYYDQLLILEAKLPVNEVQIPFKWKDAFDKGTIFGGRIRLTVTSLAYERVCILFNIAALQSVIAEKQDVDSDEGLQIAAKCLQVAAGIFKELKQSVVAAIHQEPTPDLNTETLSVLEALMLAQAQEIFTRKAIADNRKDGVIAKLCSQCEDMYAEVLKSLQKDTLRHLWDKEWIPTVAGKQAGLHALCQYYQSQVCRAEKRVGEEIARLEHASELLKVGQSRSGKPQLFSDYGVKIQKNLAECKRDNDFIYHEHVPDPKTLGPVAKAALAKPTPVPERFTPNAPPLFERLCPVSVHQALAAFDVRRGEMVNSNINQLREATNLLNSTLTSLNLPAAIEPTSGDELPHSLVEKSDAIKAAGGIQALNAMINNLPDLLQRNREILDEAERMLNEERQSDDTLRAQFKEKWNRTSSEKLTDTLRSNLERYRTIINNATGADKTVQTNFNAHKEGMQILSLSKDEMRQKVPTGSGVDLTPSRALETLRSLMEEVEAIKAEREVTESELKNVPFDMKGVFLRALAQDGAISEPAISIETLGKGLQPLQGQVAQSLERQKVLIAQIQSAHSEWTRGSKGPTQRDEVLKSLTAAHDAFMKIQKDLQEGTKFYSDLTELLIVFQNKIADFCFARKTEKEELLKDLTQNASRSGNGPAGISVPSSHVAAQGPKQAPARPPPPSSTGSAPPAVTTYSPGAAPYPVGAPAYMPVPYGAVANAPYPTYAPPPMPQGFNPYATLPYNTQPPAGNYAYPQYPQQQGQPGQYPGYPYPPQQPGQQPPGTW